MCRANEQEEDWIAQIDIFLWHIEVRQVPHCYNTEACYLDTVPQWPFCILVATDGALRVKFSCKFGCPVVEIKLVCHPFYPENKNMYYSPKIYM